MDTDGALAPVLHETTSFLHYFSDMPGRRQAGKVACRLEEILLLAHLATLAGAGGVTDIARFGHKKLNLLRRLVPFANGAPSHDHLGDIFAALDLAAFRRFFTAWVGGLSVPRRRSSPSMERPRGAPGARAARTRSIGCRPSRRDNASSWRKPG